MPFEAWARQAVDLIKSRDFTVFDLHDCYADLWLPHYAGFLRTISPLGILRTLDEVADAAILEQAA
jgi:hypothetical protein